jgi:hypothetical protein
MQKLARLFALFSLLILAGCFDMTEEITLMDQAFTRED